MAGIVPGDQFEQLIAMLTRQYPQLAQQGGMMPNMVQQPPAMPAQPSFETMGRGQPPAAMAQQLQPPMTRSPMDMPPQDQMAGNPGMQPFQGMPDWIQQMQREWMMRNAGNRFLPGGSGLFGGGMGDML